MASANRIADLRKAADLSRTDLAARLGVGEATVARWELGKTGIPDQRKLDLAELFGVSVLWLMGWPDNGNGANGEQEANAA